MISLTAVVLMTHFDVQYAWPLVLCATAWQDFALMFFSVKFGSSSKSSSDDDKGGA